MDVEPARPMVSGLRQAMDSLRLPGITPTPRKRNLPVIQLATNLNLFRIIKFN